MSCRLRTYSCRSWKTWALSFALEQEIRICCSMLKDTRKVTALRRVPAGFRLDTRTLGLTETLSQQLVHAGRSRVGSIFICKERGAMGFLSRLAAKTGRIVGEPVDAGSGLPILAPISGTVLGLEQTGDPAFSTGAMGDGAAILPAADSGSLVPVLAPVSGTLMAVFPTGHAFADHRAYRRRNRKYEGRWFPAARTARRQGCCGSGHCRCRFLEDSCGRS